MRIDPNPLPQPIAESDRSAAQNTAAASGNPADNSALAPDQAELSTSHAQVQALAAQASQLPEIRRERVVALRQTVQNGSYRPSPERVAQAIFAHMILGSAASNAALKEACRNGGHPDAYLLRAG